MRAPASEAELLGRARAIAGGTLAELADSLGLPLPGDPRRAKGWAGQLVETALGAPSAGEPGPDFPGLGIELKTIPVTPAGRPRESTWVCIAPMEDLTGLHWERSLVRAKLARVLWVPTVDGMDGGFQSRRIGAPLLWSPSPEEEAVIRADWEEFIEDIALGRIHTITGRRGTALQLRPKAANARERNWTTDEDGGRTLANPRGFYLRASFTAALLARHFGALRPAAGGSPGTGGETVGARVSPTGRDTPG